VDVIGEDGELHEKDSNTMSAQFPIRSSDASLLEQATRVAHEFARQYIRDDVAGIVFLGAIARGYFDRAADIDIALFTQPGAAIALPSQFLKVNGLEMHCHLADYESEHAASWNMAKRWTYAQGQIHYDPEGKIARLLAAKVPLRPEEKRWLLMSGLVLSEWYINRLTQLWVERGNLVSAHHMCDEGLSHFFSLLFGLNDQLVADIKWRYYCVERLPRLPSQFRERIQDVMLVGSLSMEELARRRAAFMELWRELQPVVEQEVRLSFDEMIALV
jgi:hypothetical protein